MNTVKAFDGNRKLLVKSFDKILPIVITVIPHFFFVIGCQSENPKPAPDTQTEDARHDEEMNIFYPTWMKSHQPTTSV